MGKRDTEVKKGMMRIKKDTEEKEGIWNGKWKGTGQKGK